MAARNARSFTDKLFTYAPIFAHLTAVSSSLDTSTILADIIIFPAGSVSLTTPNSSLETSTNATFWGMGILWKGTGCE